MTAIQKFLLLVGSVLFTVLGCECKCASADVYELVCPYTEDGRVENHGSATCIYAVKGRSIFLTAKHNFNPLIKDGRIRFMGEWLRIWRVVLCSECDLALFEVPTMCKATRLGTEPDEGALVTVSGYGPTVHGTIDSPSFNATLTKYNDNELENFSTLRGIDGSHVISGDSGGSVEYVNSDGNGERSVVGITVVAEKCNEEPPTSRTQLASKRARTGFIRSSTIVRFVNQQYGVCPGGTCQNIRVVPRYSTPMIGIGIPCGPTQVYGEAIPVRPAPPIYTPLPRQQEVSQQPTEYAIGPKGDKGDKGDTGDRGDSVTPEQIEPIIHAWLEANVDRLRGPKGDKGDTGKANSADLSAFEARLTDVERRKFRMVLVQNGKILKDQTYNLSEMEQDPVAIDLEALRKTANVGK